MSFALNAESVKHKNENMTVQCDTKTDHQTEVFCAMVIAINTTQFGV